jgi:beta-lactamase regulating signal transducer with metallopeptidase domain
MNAFIEILNLCGGFCSKLAWPLFWQSSVLILILCALDFSFRHRLRPAVRYALWLLVLIKLLLPPSLALPVSLAWWVRPVQEIVTTRQPSMVTVVLSQTENPQSAGDNLNPTPPPLRTSLSHRAGIFLAWSGVSGALLAWMLNRCLRIRRLLRHATPAPSEVEAAFSWAQARIGLKSAPRVQLTFERISPAVCGWLRPTIILPESLVRNFNPEQLRAVLLHELVHVRRGDVWVNWVQTILQIIFWWHPLVWLANARIRRLREEAVDDAVMSVLSPNEDVYAPTLLEVARLALDRSQLNLGLVGILESGAALRERIERLVDWQRPKRCGLGLISTCGVLLFAMTIVPMGNARTRVDETKTPKIAEAPVSKQNHAETGTTVQADDKPVILIEARFSEVSDLVAAPDDRVNQLRPQWGPGQTNMVVKSSAAVEKLRALFDQPQFLRPSPGF